MNKTIFKKRAAALAAAVILCSAMAVAQEARTHVVQRGETLESIAESYGVTADDIIRLNSDAAQFVYVGMELRLPVKAAKADADKPATAEAATTSSHTGGYKPDSKKVSGQNGEGTFETEVFLGLSINNYVGGDIKDTKSKVGFNVGITGRYFFTDNWFAETSVGLYTKGYKADNTLSSGDYWDDEGANYDSELETTMATYNLEIPINAGYRFVLTDKSSLKVKAGPYITYALAGEQKVKGYSTIYPDIHSSETEYIDESTDIGDIEGFNSFGLGFDIGVSYDYAKFSLSATFQRGLTKLFKDSKVYEQNFMLTLGYKL